MKKFFKVLGFLLLALVIAGGVFAYKNRNNIAGVIAAVKYDKEELKQHIDNSGQNLKTEISSYLDEDLRDFTEEEKQSIENGEATKEEVLAEIINEAPAPKKQEKTSDEIIRRYTATLLSLESKYLGSIDALLNEAVAEFYNLPPKDRTYSSKMSVMQGYVGRINSLEASCDSEVEAILASLKKELKEINADTSIIKTIKKAYNDEKSLKKAYYIDLYS